MDFKVRTYGKYFLLDKLATGGMAEVFKAKTFGVRGFERLLVIKQILPHLTKDREFVEMFVDEAKISVELSHANIVQVFDLGKIGNNYFIAMEYIEGKDLRALLKKSLKAKKPLPLSHPPYIAIEVLKGLEYAHKKKDAKSGDPLGIIHRDISPQNIMISYDGEVKIVDFGIAKAERRLNETQAGVLKGKFGYMSPEQAMGYEVDPRTDIFSCGILLFEMLTGRRLFMGENDLETLELIREADIPPITKYNPDVPTELEEIIYRALQRDADDRFADARSMQLELTKFMFHYNADFTSADLAATLKSVFDKEIHAERVRLQQALTYIDKHYDPDKRGSGTLVADVSEEVSFVHPNPDASLVHGSIRDSDVTEADSSLKRAADDLPRSGKSYTSDASSLPSLSSHPSAKERALSELKTQYQPRESISQRHGMSGAHLGLVGRLSKLRPWLLPALLLGCIVFLVYLQFFRTPGSDSGEPIATSETVTLQRGVIDLASEPLGAEVYVDDQLYGTTPVSLELEAKKDQTFLFRLAGYVEKSMTVYVDEGLNQPLSISLEKDQQLLSSLRITSKPSGAKIYIDGEESGKRTPFTLDDLQRGREVTLRLHKAGYESKEDKVLLDTRVIEKSFRLRAKLASLTIDTEPSGAKIFVNSTAVGTAPATTKVRMQRAVKIAAKLSGYQDYAQEVTVSQPSEQLRFVLKPRVLEYGYISINADPWAMVFLDGQPLGNTPILGTKVTVGNHTLELQHSDYGKKRETIVVNKTHTKENPLLIIKDMKK